jgi:hypothetical protein
MRNDDRPDFTSDLSHYFIDGVRMDEEQALALLQSQGLSQQQAYFYLKDLVQKLNTQLKALLLSYQLIDSKPVQEQP